MNDNNGFENRMNQASQNNNNQNSNMQNIHNKDNVNRDSDFYKKASGLGPNSRRDNSKPKGSSSSNSPMSIGGVTSKGSTGNSSIRKSNGHGSGSNSPLRNTLGGSSMLPFGNPLARRGGISLINNPLTRMLPGGKAASTLSSILRKNKSKSMFSAPFGIGAKKEEAEETGSDQGDNSENNQGDPIEPPNKKEENRVEEISIRLPFKIKLALIISACTLAIFMVLLISLINTDTIQKLIANRFSVSIFDDKDSAADIDEDGNNSGEWVREDDAFIINKNSNIYLKNNFIDDKQKSSVKFATYKSSKDVDLSSLKEYYKVDCSGDDCEKTALYKFYRKLYDIYFMYKYKYHINIDLPLLMSTLDYNSKSQNDLFNNHQSDYDIEAVRENDYDNDNITILDWENDFKNLDGYKYLNANDFRYDMQILAKNMVKKKITYKCVKDDDKNKSKDKKANNIETSNYEKKLKCDKDYSLDKESIEASYKLDKDQYDEFLLEYIEHKFYMKGSKVDTSQKAESDEQIGGSVKSNSLAEAMVKRGLEEHEKFKAGKTSPYTYQSAQGLGSGVAWCAAFVSYVSKHASYKGKTVADIVGKTSASTGDFMQYFHRTKGINFYYNDSCSYLKGKNGKGKYTPKPGDYIFFDWDSQFRDISQAVPGSGPQDHTAMVEKYKDGKVYIIEGNYSNRTNRRAIPITNCQLIGYGSWY